MSLHLMESDKLDRHITTFPMTGENLVTKVGETGKKLKEVKNGKGKLYINSKQYFDNLPEEVWNFHISGYGRSRHQTVITPDQGNRYPDSHRADR